MGVIHLATGIFVCGKPRFWCRAKPEIDYEAHKVMNGTDKPERATCEDCLDERDLLMAQYNGG